MSSPPPEASELIDAPDAEKNRMPPSKYPVTYIFPDGPTQTPRASSSPVEPILVTHCNTPLKSYFIKKPSNFPLPPPLFI